MKTLTLRQLIKLVLSRPTDLWDKALKKVGSKNSADGYSFVMHELLDMPKAKAYKWPIYTRNKDHGYDVCLLNRKAVNPPKGKKAWGGKDFPKGYYNVNDPKYARYYALTGIGWEELIDTPILNPGRLGIFELLADILWELTFYGWTNAENKANMEKMKKETDAALQEYREGKCIEILPKDGKGYAVVIPNSVLDTIGKIGEP